MPVKRPVHGISNNQPFSCLEIIDTEELFHQSEETKRQSLPQDFLHWGTRCWTKKSCRIGASHSVVAECHNFSIGIQFI